MPGLRPDPVTLTKTERIDLENLVNKHSTPQQIALRSRIILLAADGKNHQEIGRELKISRFAASRWRRRWLNLAGADKSVLERLQDAPRSGRPPTFTPEQLTHLFAIACEDPRESGRPISHWTNQELADELIKRGIVETISSRHVGRLLEEADLKPHQIRYWLTPSKDKDFKKKSRTSAICTSAPRNALNKVNER
jgi:putative transposase